MRTTLVICMLFIGTAVFGQEIKAYHHADKFIHIYLPYKVYKSSRYIFSRDSASALDIISIYADGKKLSIFDDIRESYIIRPLILYCTNVNKTFEMDMTWERVWDDWVWNDGRGILSIEEPEGLRPYTNAYKMSIDTKRLEITYRVLLPKYGDDTRCYEEIQDKLPKDWMYSDTYTVTVILNKKR